MSKLLLNAMVTPDGTMLISKHVHDYVVYKDKNGKTYMVDGGTDYLKRSNNGDEIDACLYEDSPFEEIRKYVCRGAKGKDGTEPLKWIPIKDMDLDHLKACIVYNKERGLEDSLNSKLYQREIDYRTVKN